MIVNDVDIYSTHPCTLNQLLQHITCSILALMVSSTLSSSSTMLSSWRVSSSPAPTVLSSRGVYASPCDMTQSDKE